MSDIPDLNVLLTMAVEARRAAEKARGSRAETATVGGRLMLPVALAESRVEYGAVYAVAEDGTVTQEYGLGYGYGEYGSSFVYGP